MNLEEFSRNRPNTDLEGGCDVRGSIPLEVIDAHLLRFYGIYLIFLIPLRPYNPNSFYVSPFFRFNLWGLRQSSPPGRSSPELYFGGFIAPRNKIRYKYRKTNSKFLSCTDPFFISPSTSPFDVFCTYYWCQIQMSKFLCLLRGVLN